MPMNRPTAVELLAAVREALEHHSPGESSNAAEYQRRIAINVLKILEREATSTASFDEAESARLRAHLGRDANVADLNAELCRRIARGDEDSRRGELLTLLYRATLDKLAVDNPRFAAYQRALKDHTLGPNLCQQRN